MKSGASQANHLDLFVAGGLELIRARGGTAVHRARHCAALAELLVRATQSRGAPDGPDGAAPSGGWRQPGTPGIPGTPGTPDSPDTPADGTGNTSHREAPGHYNGPAALRHLPTAIEEAHRAGVWPDRLANAVGHLRSALPWSTFYARSELTSPFLDDIAMATVVGSRAPIYAADVTLGLFLQSPHTAYPPHGHEAPELYIVLGGSAEFYGGNGVRLRDRDAAEMSDSADPGTGGRHASPGAHSNAPDLGRNRLPGRLRQPGDAILHERNEPHAMHTGSQPLLALYAWHGPIRSPSWFLKDSTDPHGPVVYPELL